MGRPPAHSRDSLAVRDLAKEKAPRCRGALNLRCCVEELLMLSALAKVDSIGKSASTNQDGSNPCSGHKNLLEM